MNSTQKIFFFIVGFSLLSLVSLQAQDDLPTEQVEVIKNFEATLEETEKVILIPELPTLDTSTKLQQYQIPIVNQLDVEYPAPKIRPLAMRSEDLPKVYKGYVKLGAGLPTSFYGEGSYGTFVQDKYDLGIDIKHHSANFKGDDVENQKFGLTKIGGRGTYYLEQGYAVGGNLSYASDRIRYYGYNFDDSGLTNIPESDVEQRFQTFDVGAKIFNGVQNVGDINYNAGFNYYNLRDEYAAKETGLEIFADFTKWIAGTHSFDLGLAGDFTSYKDTATQKLNNFYIKPAFTFHGERFKAKLGANIAANSDNVSFFPNAEATVNVTGSELAVFVGAEGNLQKNTFRSLSDYNPFVSSRSPAMDLRNSEYFHYYGGIKGNLRIVEYSVQVGFKMIDSLAVFVSDPSPIDPVQRRFAVIYDNGNIFNISGTLKANITRNVELVGTIGINRFDLDSLSKAWHLPSLTLNSALIVSALENKLQLKAQVFAENGVPIPVTNIEEGEKLNSLFDLSFGAEYFFTDNIGAFLEINNLLNNKRERWQYYPTYGLNVLVGVSARF